MTELAWPLASGVSVWAGWEPGRWELEPQDWRGYSWDSSGTTSDRALAVSPLTSGLGVLVGWQPDWARPLDITELQLAGLRHGGPRLYTPSVTRLQTCITAVQSSAPVLYWHCTTPLYTCCTNNIQNCPENIKLSDVLG